MASSVGLRSGKVVPRATVATDGRIFGAMACFTPRRPPWHRLDASRARHTPRRAASAPAKAVCTLRRENLASRLSPCPPPSSERCDGAPDGSGGAVRSVFGVACRCRRIASATSPSFPPTSTRHRVSASRVTCTTVGGQVRWSSSTTRRDSASASTTGTPRGWSAGTCARCSAGLLSPPRRPRRPRRVAAAPPVEAEAEAEVEAEAEAEVEAEVEVAPPLRMLRTTFSLPRAAAATRMRMRMRMRRRRRSRRRLTGQPWRWRGSGQARGSSCLRATHQPLPMSGVWLAVATRRVSQRVLLVARRAPTVHQSG
jgi:hypothetical protein